MSGWFLGSFAIFKRLYSSNAHGMQSDFGLGLAIAQAHRGKIIVICRS
ncbi:hypothetical protein [Nostoc sp. MG11]|nr:hypothetical protein [Nostoc sp. MG11]